ncbi:hypothetical protein [Microcoleus sp. OTE_8_concoct_300]|uniref:hypothetical protein n=1 Tax=Microcoleus sp. OTE_8_concoct_300 TaxID=2964710 RepID=UPI00403F30D4
MFNTAGLFEENQVPGNVAGVSAGTPDLFGSNFDPLNRIGQSALGNTNGLFDTRYDVTQKPDWAAAATGSAIDLFGSFTDFGLQSSVGDNLKVDSSLKSQSAVSTQVQRDKLTGMDIPVGDSGGGPELTLSQTSSVFPDENWAFNFKDYTINHQGLNTLNIKIGYGLKPGITPNEYPDFVPIAQSIDNFLVNYPNETDFFEIVNKNLTAKVLNENPALTDVTIQLEVLPTDRFPYNLESTVFRSRSGQIQENANLSLKDYAMNHDELTTLNLDVNYQYKPGIAPNEYPNFVPIYNKIDNFLTTYPNETDFWEVVNKNLTQTILNENPALAAIKIDLNVLPTQNVPYKQTSKVTRTKPSNPQGTQPAAQLTEKWNFTLADYPIQHQGLNSLNIDVNYKYKDGIQNNQYPDFVPIAQSINNFLVNYPNETDYWEIVNKNLTQKIIADNPVLSSVTVNLDVLPTNREPYENGSTVTRTQDGKLGEGWEFKLPNYSINHQGLNNLNIDVKYQYKPGIRQDEYPNFVPIAESIDSFLTNYPNETDFFEIVNKGLTQKLLAENPALDSLQINLEVLPTNKEPYAHASIVSIA